MNQIKYSVRKAVRPTVAPLTAAVSLALGASSLHAATITVNDLTDALGGTTCTLRNAIYAASLETAQGGCVAGTAGGNEIVFASGLSGTIQLDADAADLYDDATLRIGSSLTITGPGADQLTIRGDNASSVFYAKYSAEEVTIAGVTITNGNSERGGGIYSRAVGLGLVESRVTGNTASLAGGGVWHDQVVDYGFFFSNNSQFDNNIAFGQTAADGGGGLGIDFGATGGYAVVLNSIVEANTAFGPGGGVMIRSDDFTTVGIVGSELQSNTSKYGGGGAFLDLGYATLSLFGTDFIDNTASSDFGGGFGGGAAVLERNTVYSRAEITIAESNFYENQAAGSGGGLGVYVVGTDSPGTKFISSYYTYMAYNSAGADGGGLVIISGAEVDLALMASASLANNAEAAGGGMRLIAQQSDITIDSVYNFANQSLYGAGIMGSFNQVALEAENLRSKYNQAGYAGGGALLTLGGGSTATLTRPVMYGNNGGFNGGGLLVTGSQASVDMSEGIFRANTAGTGGGLMAAGADVDLIVKYSELSDNFAIAGAGGYLTASNSSFAIANSTISGNSASGNGGGLLINGSDTTPTSLKYSTTAYNQAGGDGGGIMANASDVNIVNSIVSGNTADGSGGAVEGSGAFYVSYSLIDDPVTNANKYDEGGNIFKYSADLAALDDNGGPTRTHAIDSNSRAFNAGSESVYAIYDQRLLPRVMLGRVDMGAFEAETLADSIFRDRFQQAP